MRAHLGMLKVELVGSLRRDGRIAPRRRGPRRSRGSFVPVVIETRPMRLAN